jgi:hypothetical protein
VVIDPTGPQSQLIGKFPHVQQGIYGLQFVGVVQVSTLIQRFCEQMFATSSVENGKYS